jgi:hypothetical protein
LNFSFFGLLIFLCADFLQDSFNSSNIKNIALIKKSLFVRIIKFLLPLFFILPGGIGFTASWYLACAVFKIGFEALLIPVLLLFNFIQILFLLKIFNLLSNDTSQENTINGANNNLKKLVIFVLLLVIFFAAILIGNSSHVIDQSLQTRLLKMEGL